MTARKNAFMVATSLALLTSVHAETQTVRLSVDPATVVNRIDEKVYGHFLEHIYHSCNGGLWGDLVWNRTFEQNEMGRWMVQGGEIAQEGLGTNIRLTFGDADWTDYEYVLEAKKTDGQEGFLILFRVKNEKEFYWCNLGGWGNQRHGLERGLAAENRWGPVGPQPRGRIESGRWYGIRVRCEGPRIQVWLDDERIIDFTDDRRAHLQGKVGIGTWATQALFRNLEVSALDGTVLYKDLPQSLTDQNVARFWQVYGGARAYLHREDALNSHVCQRIVTDSTGGGIQQGGFCIRAGQVYQGSLWARGYAKQGLTVELLDGKGREAVTTLDAPSSQWREFTFKLQSDWSCEDAVLRIGAGGEGEVWIDQVSMMPQAWKRQGGFRPDLLEAIAELRPPVIRWPGGCFASSYQWKQGIGPQHERLPHPREIWDDLDVYSYGTDEFIQTCRRVGAEPLIVVNIGTEAWNSDARTHDYTQDILDWVEYCNGPADSKWGSIRAANGHPEPYNVKYWEIDNETWHLPAEAYAEEVLRIAPLMREADPSIKLAACGSGGMSRRGANGMPYNRAVIDRCADVLDYISIHHYENPDRFAEGPGDYEAFFRELGEMIAASSNPNLKVYVSEWNAQSTDWRTGLYCGGLLNAFERCGDFLEIGGPALFLRHTSATAWDNAFINFDQCGWFPAPNYVVMKLWRDHYAPERIAVSGQSGPLNVVGTRRESDDAVIVKIVNPSDENFAMEITCVADVTGGSARVVAPGSLQARNSLPAPHAVQTKPLAVRMDGSKALVDLPALSAAVVTLETRGMETPESQMEPVVPVKAEPFPLEDVRLLDGPFQEARGRDAAYLLRLEPDRLLHRFRLYAGLEPKGPIYDGWETMGISGHSLGHYLSACSLMYASTGDERFHERVNYIVDELEVCQEAGGDGYVGGVQDGRRVFAEVATGDIRSKGFDLNGIWVPWYTQHKLFAGLLEAHRHCHNEKALRVARRLAAWVGEVIGGLSNEQMQRMLACEHGGMNEVMAEMYAVTGQEEYLELSRRFYHSAVLDPLAQGHDCLPGLHGNTQIPKIIGVARRHELTGDARDRRIAEFFWDRVVHHHSYVTGGHGNHEYFGPPDQFNDRLSASTTETCNTYNMLKLTRHLFAWDASVEYADYYERALYNHILASQNPDDGMVCYFVPLKSGEFKRYSNPFHDFSCCHGTGMENHAKYGDSIYFHDDEGLYVNLFIPSELNWRNKGVRLRQTTDFPVNDETRLEFACDEPVEATVRIRCPRWATSPLDVKVNGRPLDVEPRPGQYASVHRQWRDGDVIRVRIPMGLRLEALPDNPKRVAVLYGPILLAGDLGEVERDRDGSAAANELRIPVLVTENRPVDRWLRRLDDRPLAFETAGVGRPQDVTLIPFFRMHHRRYGVYWDLFTVAQWEKRQAEYQAELKRLAELETRTVDVLRIGEMQPERDHNLTGERTNAGEFRGRKYRHATDGGWFSFKMKVLPDEPQELCVTYWGSDRGNREFTVFAGGMKLVTQTLQNNRPGEFYEEAYPLPEAAIQGKDRLTVRFQAHPDNTAGGVFGCAIRKAAHRR